MAVRAHEREIRETRALARSQLREGHDVVAFDEGLFQRWVLSLEVEAADLADQFAVSLQSLCLLPLHDRRASLTLPVSAIEQLPFIYAYLVFVLLWVLPFAALVGVGLDRVHGFAQASPIVGVRVPYDFFKLVASGQSRSLA